jgi:hypothetical protein
VAAVVLVAALAGATALAATTAQAQTGGGTPPAPPYFPVTVHSPKPQEQGRWSERVKVAGDLNHDKINDFWVAVPLYQRDSPNDPGAEQSFGLVYAVDGASLAEPLGQKKYPKILYKIHPPEPQIDKRFGFQIENIGDVNDDGVAEIVVGTDAQDVPEEKSGQSDNTQVCDDRSPRSEPKACNENQGKAWVFDGKTNRVLYELDNPRPQGSDVHDARFGSRLGKAGDITDDGASEVIVGASGNDNPEAPGCSDDGVAEPGCRSQQGQAFVFNGKTGALVRELNLPKEDQVPPTTCQARCGSFGLTVQGPGDVDGDKIPDQLVAAPSLNVEGREAQGRMYVFSGASAGPVDDQPIRRIDDPEPQPVAFFGFEDVTPLDPGDITGDDRAEIYGHGFFQRGEGTVFQGKSWVFDVNSSTPKRPLYEVDNPDRKSCKSFGWSMSRERDRVASPPIADGRDESNPLYVGNDPHHCQGDQRGETNTFSALTGEHEQTLPLPPPFSAEVGVPGNLGPNLGWTTASPGDLNRDGFRDFVAGAPFTDVCHIRLGTMNKELHTNQGVMIAFVSNPDNEPPPPNDRNPADNVCTDDNPPDNEQSG